MICGIFQSQLPPQSSFQDRKYLYVSASLSGATSKLSALLFTHTHTPTSYQNKEVSVGQEERKGTSHSESFLVLCSMTREVANCWGRRLESFSKWMSKTRRLCISKDALLCLEGIVLAFLSGTPWTLEKSGHSSAVLAVCAPTQISNIFGHILGPSDYSTLRALEKSIPPEDMTRGVAYKTLAFGHGPRVKSHLYLSLILCSPATSWYVLGLSFFFFL